MTAIGTPIVGMPAAPLPVSLNIVVPIIRIGGSSDLLSTAFTFPIGIQQQNRTSARGIEDGGERVCDKRHNVAFPYQASLRLKSIPRVLAERLISANERGSLLGWVRNSERHYG